MITPIEVRLAEARADIARASLALWRNLLEEELRPEEMPEPNPLNEADEAE